MPEDIVIVSNLMNPNGSVAPNTKNKLVLFLTSMERDVVPLRAPEPSGRSSSGSTPLYLNLFVMVAANFTGANYPDALKYIAMAVSYFHKHGMFDRHNSPDLDKGIERLIIDIENMSPQELSNVWGMAGGRYLPSILYRMRMVTIDGNNWGARIPTIGDPSVAVGYSPRG